MHHSLCRLRHGKFETTEELREYRKRNLLACTLGKLVALSINLSRTVLANLLFKVLPNFGGLLLPEITTQFEASIEVDSVAAFHVERAVLWDFANNTVLSNVFTAASSNDPLEDS